MKNKTKFTRSKGTTGANTKDSRGSVRVAVALVEDGRHVVGNITRSLTLKDSKVSEVIAAIKEALLEE